MLFTTLLASVVTFSASAILVTVGHGNMRWFALVPIVFWFWSALFMIRGYSLEPGSLFVHRLFWSTRIPIENVKSVAFVPNSMRGSVRTFGNGGMFSFSGYYRNTELGSYRAFVTDLTSTVVLVCVDRTLVLSPSNPEGFVQELSPLKKAA